MRLLLLSLLACTSSAQEAPSPAPDPAPTAAAPTAAAPTATDPAAAAAAPATHQPGAVVHRAAADGDREEIVVALHGLGDHPARFVAMAEDFTDVAHVVAPGGWTPRGQGFSWFPVRARQDGPELAAAVAESADQLAAWMRSEGIDEDDHVVVTGFSQGGMLSFSLALRHPTLVDLAVPIGGLLPAGLHPTSPAPAGAPEIIALHGGADEVVPTQGARDTVAALKAQGWPSELLVWEGVAHRVPTEMRVVLDAAVRAELSGADPLDVVRPQAR